MYLPHKIKEKTIEQGEEKYVHLFEKSYSCICLEILSKSNRENRELKK
jgi:hypothetical protein